MYIPDSKPEPQFLLVAGFFFSFFPKKENLNICKMHQSNFIDGEKEAEKCEVRSQGFCFLAVSCKHYLFSLLNALMQVAKDILKYNHSRFGDE